MYPQRSSDVSHRFGDVMQQVGFLIGLAEVAFDADFRRALAMLDAGRVPTPPVVAFRAETPNKSTPATRKDQTPSRDLRDARALLASISSLPLLLPGRLPHETP